VKKYEEFTEPVAKCYLLFGPNQAEFKRRRQEILDRRATGQKLPADLKKWEDDELACLESYLEAAGNL
jgi:hypothetical protein